jgi:aerobic-type carbon monoxide dehydrogenase small subunit (CoxS/CutS family)
VDADDEPERLDPIVTRRQFLVGAGAGAAVAAAASAGAVVLSRPSAKQAARDGGAVAEKPGQAGAPAGAPATSGAPAQGVALPASQRRVSLNIDGTQHDVIVDVRESLWETMTYTLGLAAANLGCDRAQCGACTVSIDGRAVNGCTAMSARLGRGQKILTVDGIRLGPGVEGLHPVQRAFWEEGGFQCGICTRGFIMSAFSLLSVNASPTRAQIREALAGNICRCSEYPKMYEAVERASADMKANPLGPIQRLAPARAGGEDVDTSGNLE